MVIKKWILSLFLCVTIFGAYANLHRDFLLDVNKTAILDLYKDFLNQQPHEYIPRSGASPRSETAPHKVVKSLERMKKHFENLRKIIPYLDIDLPIKKIKRKYFKNGFIQLRKIDPSLRILVIGCGNHPISMESWKEIFIHPDYYNDHAHEDAITIDPNLKQNPTIVGSFGVSTLDVFPDHHFEKIIIEDIDIPHILRLPHTKAEIARLLSADGELYYDLKEISRKADSVDDLLKMWDFDHDGEDDFATKTSFFGFFKRTWKTIITYIKSFF